MVDSHMVDCKTGEIYTCENEFTALCGLTNYCLVGIKGGAPGCHSNREQHSLLTTRKLEEITQHGRGRETIAIEINKGQHHHSERVEQLTEERGSDFTLMISKPLSSPLLPWSHGFYPRPAN